MRACSCARAVNLRANTAVLPPFIRRLFWVYYSFIAKLCLMCFGIITMTLAGTLASGTALAPGNVCIHGHVLDSAPDCCDLYF